MRALLSTTIGLRVALYRFRGTQTKEIQKKKGKWMKEKKIEKEIVAEAGSSPAGNRPTASPLMRTALSEINSELHANVSIHSRRTSMRTTRRRRRKRRGSRRRTAKMASWCANATGSRGRAFVLENNGYGTVIVRVHFQEFL